jgi:BirA family transcriptional regulator, biotin operon repressor / biotin---[acetyl-CoA-carboxylase] ligase
MKLHWRQIVLGIGEAATKLRAHYIHEKISSTNDWHSWSGQASELPAVCLAEQQHHGRGRDGKLWVSPPGENIYLTLGWSFKNATEPGLVGLSLAIGVAIARILNEYGLDAKVKWPNDIMVNDTKLAGILIETKIKSSGEIIAMIGVGLNYLLSDESHRHISQDATDFVSCSNDQDIPDRNYLAGKLIQVLMQACDAFDQFGFKAFRADWDRYDICRGRMVQIKDAAGVWSAYAVGINEQCGLKLLHDNVERVIYAADVSVRVC